MILESDSTQLNVSNPIFW